MSPNRKKSHSEKQVITTIRKLALGLAEAHEIGVIHRDLKPANIMVDKKAEPVVMDFGLARRSSSDDVQVTHSGAILGTPAYMSPEQVSGDQTKIGPQTDIYALGIIMYELMTGEMPFQGNLMAILQQIALNNPTKPSELREGLDPRLEKICLKMIAGDMKKRYETMNEVAKDLQTCLRKPAVKKKQVSDVEQSKPSMLPSATEESNPALISVKQSDSLASKLRNRGNTLPPRRNSKAAKKSSSSAGMNLPPKKWLMAGDIGGLVLLLGIIFFARIGKYNVQIILDDPSIKISIDGGVRNIFVNFPN
ncbi:serine/threonine protein kinase [Planctomycetaceae bacterium]|nr:serine/threonine protein kinase [Planctomycetaceae bacterium]